MVRDGRGQSAADSGGLVDAYRVAAKDMPRRRAIRLLDRIAPKLTQQEYLSLKPSFMKVFGQTLDNATNEINAADRIVDKIIHDPLPVIERPKAMGNRTGLRDAIAAMRNDLAAAREAAMQAGGEIRDAVDGTKAATHAIKQMAQEVRDETAEALSELGQFSNGGPA
jgi:hypothetical protein